ADEPPVPLGRGDVEDPDEVLEVLLDRDVERHLERRLVTICARQCRSVPLCEECERDGDREERERGRCRARRPAQADGGQPGGDRAPPAVAPPASEYREDPRDHDRDGDGDQAREEKQEQRRAFATSESILIGDPARESHGRYEERCDGYEVEPAETAAPAPRKRDREPYKRCRQDRGRERESDAARREDALAQNVPDRCVREARSQTRSEDPDEPAYEDAHECDEGALDPAQQPELPR